LSKRLAVVSVSDCATKDGVLLLVMA
jgi:hypothetical protein